MGESSGGGRTGNRQIKTSEKILLVHLLRCSLIKLITEPSLPGLRDEWEVRFWIAMHHEHAKGYR